MAANTLIALANFTIKMIILTYRNGLDASPNQSYKDDKAKEREPSIFECATVKKILLNKHYIKDLNLRIDARINIPFYDGSINAEILNS